MKGSSKVIMGATLVLVVSLAMVLGLILVLLAELYCSLLLRRRKLITTTNSSSEAAAVSTAESSYQDHMSSSNDHHHQNQNHQNHDHDQVSPIISTTPLGNIYSQGVLQAPRSLLFPAVMPLPTQEKQHQVIDIIEPTQQEEATTTSPTTNNNDKHFVYISNPIYENAEGQNTPFETPDTSPSRLEEIGSSSGSSSPLTPPLTPMKKLPAEASSVSLGDARSLLATDSATESNSVNGLSNSSSSATPCTSPSW